MTCWIASLNRENWEVVKSKQVWGIPKRNRNILQRVKPGDAILFYVRQEKAGDEILPSAIMGDLEVVSEPYEDHSRIFVTPQHMGDEVFPYRVKVEPIAVFADPLEFKPLIPDLAFIRNKTMWTGHLRVAMREIPEEDYQFILKRAGQGA
ncbi:EVE domain-containing protein [Methanoculleus sp. UBA303]|jgi:predicted RNA-binding protein|uniref:EVE domain-containing protein n=1 Tax=Methanoculleus sp. UBA303 TaxID=1915497 RepID=UPI0025E90595|nr:EVE domain-containing protein [Methanoculleus sp. UBA303]